MQRSGQPFISLHLSILCQSCRRVCGGSRWGVFPRSGNDIIPVAGSEMHIPVPLWLPVSLTHQGRLLPSRVCPLESTILPIFLPEDPEPFRRPERPVRCPSIQRVQHNYSRRQTHHSHYILPAERAGPTRSTLPRLLVLDRQRKGIIRYPRFVPPEVASIPGASHQSRY